MFDEIHQEFVRLSVEHIGLEADERQMGTQQFVKVTTGARSCSVAVEGFLEMLRHLPEGAGAAAVIAALESSAIHADQWATYSPNEAIR